MPGVRAALKVLKPATVIAWHRAELRAYWRWKSRARGGLPCVSPEVRELIREMSIANPLCGAPRKHGELLKLGINVDQTTVSKYMARKQRAPSPGRKTFLRNHVGGIIAGDVLVVVSFRLLYGFDPAACAPGVAVAGGNSPSECPMDRTSTWLCEDLAP